MSGTDDDRLNLAELLTTQRQRGLWRVPRLVRGALALVWRAAPREFFLSTILQVIGAAAMAGQVLAAREALARVLALDSGSGFSSVAPWLGILAGLSAVVSFSNTALVEQQRLLSELVARHAVDQVLEVATAVELTAFDSPAFHNRLMRARVNASSRPAQMATGVLGIMSALLTIAGVSGAVFLIEPLFLAILLFAYLPLWVATARASRVTYAFTAEQTERDRRRDYLSYLLIRREDAAELRALGLASFLRNRHDLLYSERIADLRTMVRTRMRLGLVGGLVTSALTAGTLGILIWFVTDGRLTLSEAGAAGAGILLLGQRLQVLAGSTGSLFESSLFIEDFTTFVEAKPALRDAQPSGSPPDSFRTLTVDDVRFTYPSATVPALDSVSLSIQQGQVVALVGENGSGKTTLAKILAGLYRPDEGAVCWDGVDTATFDPVLLRKSVGVIFQDFVRYLFSARDNVAFGSSEAIDDFDRAVEAARRASADEFLAALPDGYDTLLGTEFWGGSELSVGQWQRVAHARAFFRDAPFLILDEPTSGLDPRAEAALFAKMRTLYRDRTVLLISHRFSTVRNADRIYVLRAGRIVEEGTHLDLMAYRGLYHDLFTIQANAYLDPTTST